ncbi:MAG: rod shape-determining protein MreD [Candidatus Marinimicrobia bacterium]|nr:rod shape-determining protein MreD [Candidatus Neomarinimicrobiota bacterium]
MITKFILYIGICIVVLFAQIIFVQWLTIEDIRPDFILILVILTGRLQGKVAGSVSGFLFGLIIDSIGVGSYLGLSALVKTITGFISGYLKGSKLKMNSYLFYFFNFLIVTFHFLIFYMINFLGSDLSPLYVISRYVFPSTLYTYMLFVIIDKLLSLEK